MRDQLRDHLTLHVPDMRRQLVTAGMLAPGVLARVPAQARSGAWLDSTRAQDYGMVLGTLYFAACLGLMLWSGAAELGNVDFTSFYAAGRLALSDPTSVYDIAAHHAMQKAVTGNASLAYSYFFYPPVLLLLCAPAPSPSSGTGEAPRQALRRWRWWPAPCCRCR